MRTDRNAAISRHRSNLILGIETSGPHGAVALCRGDVCIDERDLESERQRHAQGLVSAIEKMLGGAGLSLRQLEGVAVSIGPGSFTGLRVGVVCAKTLAYALGRPLAAVDTLQVISENSPDDVRRVHVIADAQRGDVYAGTYSRSVEGEWTCESPPAIVSAADWLPSCPRDDVFSGPGLTLHGRWLSEGCLKLPEENWVPRAATVARLGSRRIAANELADCSSVEPFYLRRSAAEERADQPPAQRPLA